MDYNEFKNRLIEVVREKLEGEAEVSFVTRKKNNQTDKEGICVQKPDGTQRTVIYLEDLYHVYEKTADMEGLTEKIICIFGKAGNMPGADILNDWETVKDHVRIRLVKKDWNKERLENRVYRDYLDFAVVLEVEMETKGDFSGSSPVEKDAPKFWGVSEGEIYQKAMENLYKEKYYILPIDMFLPENYPAGEIKMYILLRENRNFGAGLLLREDILHRFAEEQGGSLYILPSSVHDLILIKQEEDMDVCELKEVVRQVNGDSAVMNPEEVLSDSVYVYDREQRIVRIAM